MTTWFGARVAVSRWTLAVALGDAAAIALFVALGEIQHGGTAAAGLSTYAQFGLGWLVVAIPAGVYAADALAPRHRAVMLGVAAWVVAALIGQLIRLLVMPGFLVQPAFVLVSVGFGAVFIGAWRFLAATAVS